MTMRSVLVAVLVAGALVAACAAPAAGPDPAASGVDRLTDGRPVPRLVWSPCRDAPVPGFECADLAVPRDHRDPASPTWTLAVSRLRATDPERRRGVLVSNPGGPGAPGRWNTLGVDQLTDGRLRPSYDLVAIDVRGTGASRPAARCGLTGRLLDEATADPTAVNFGADAAVARDIAASCAAAGPDVLPFLGTVDVVRDLDLLRAALGEDRLTFSGVSYGSSLGTAFASMYPDRTDRVLLDSQDDDTVGWRERFRLSNAAVDARFAEVAERTARDPRWALGTADDVRARYLDARDRAVRGAPDERALAARLADDAAGTDVDQRVAVGFGVRCIDSPWSRDVDDYRRTFEADRAAYPVSGGARGTIEPCAFWPWSPREPLPRLVGVGLPQALILQDRSDPATPLVGAQRVRAALGPRAVMITTGDGGHGVLGRNRCATDAAVAWLVDGDLPAGDRSC